MLDFKIETLKDKHLDDVMEIEALSYGKHHWSRESFESEILNSASSYLSAVNKNGKCIGYMGIWKIIDEAHITNLSVHPDYQNTYFNDIRYKRIIGYATELDMIVVVHGGMDPLSPENIHNTPKMSAEVLDDVKPTKLVLAHMGGHAMFDDVERYLVGREVYFDTAVILDTIDKEQFMRITRNHGADKILFGSDSPWADQSQYVELLKNLPLSEVERNAIFHENAEKLLFKNN